MVQNISNIFDLHDIFINELVGDPFLTIIIALILIWFLAVKSRMPLELSLLFGLLALAIFYVEMPDLIFLWVFVVLIIGGMFFYTIAKAVNTNR